MLREASTDMLTFIRLAYGTSTVSRSLSCFRFDSALSLLCHHH
ncbi:hypothetical protein FOPG_17048 [Fusarium oxysporum f. sp. conglutinans race 2 54008]|uniref:Uncharacterized protein n=1 Tax=Fusarium oxysporum f. sp. conglutinans race 2 54008 TaxID=1089457 RepID=X0GTW5_FUSOX|nr:hypothetical protein FOPG_17048 [Fusarium oxysporum f. sp. conglutinans race 2 54008]